VARVVYSNDPAPMLVSMAHMDQCARHNPKGRMSGGQMRRNGQ